jgi:serine protease
MDRFCFPLPTLACAAALAALPVAAATAAGAARELPGPGVIVQLRPGAVVQTEPVASAALRDSPQALREQAQAAWQRQHALRTDRLKALAVEAGVPLAGVGSAGTALRLDFAQPLTGEPLQAAMRRLRLHPDVASVTPNVRWQRQQSVTVPNDPLFAQQWHLQAPTLFASALNLPAAWAQNTGAASAPVVAVVDGGVRYDHPDLAGHLLAGYDFVSELDIANDGNGRDADASDPGDWVTRAESLTPLYEGCDVSNSSWHGTAIAGQIAAATNNSAGVAGVHWGAKVLPVRVAGKCGALLSDLLDGMRWAAGLPVTGVPANTTPAKVINLSYGGSGPCDSAYQQTVNDLMAAGTLVVVAAGNSAEPVARPADCKGVVAVGAVRGDGAKTSYSSYGPNVALAVPGGSGISGADAGLLTTLNSGRTVPENAVYGSLVGTSFAAPLVAGTAALMLSAQPTLGPADLSRLLKASVRPHTAQPNLSTCSPTARSQTVCNCTTDSCGTGLLDASLALAAATPVVVPTPTPTPVEPTTPVADSGGGGQTGVVWGLALWAWLAALAFSRGRLASPAGPRRSGRC